VKQTGEWRGVEGRGGLGEALKRSKGGCLQEPYFKLVSEFPFLAANSLFFCYKYTGRNQINPVKNSSRKCIYL